jgi:hypothetical protein
MWAYVILDQARRGDGNPEREGHYRRAGIVSSGRGATIG